MDEFVARQYNQMNNTLLDYREGAISLNNLIAKIEGLARILGEEFWSEDIFPIIVDLERINSELIDKQRKMSPTERDQIEKLLANVEGIVNAKIRN